MANSKEASTGAGAGCVCLGQRIETAWDFFCVPKVEAGLKFSINPEDLDLNWLGSLWRSWLLGACAVTYFLLYLLYLFDVDEIATADLWKVDIPVYIGGVLIVLYEASDTIQMMMTPKKRRMAMISGLRFLAILAVLVTWMWYDNLKGQRATKDPVTGDLVTTTDDLSDSYVKAMLATQAIGGAVFLFLFMWSARVVTQPDVKNAIGLGENNKLLSVDTRVAV